MKLKIVILSSALLALVITSHAQGLMNKLKQKAEQAAEKALEKKVDEKTGANTGNSGSSSSSGSSSGSSSPSNKGGAGLITTPPDVKGNLTDAETAYKAKSYGEARYAVQQAMLGVEMEIGQDVLKSLPESVSGLNKDGAADEVTSTGWGWVGLTIKREYRKEDKDFKATISNNAAWMAAVNIYLTGGYAQTTGGSQQNWKQTKLKGYKAVIDYDENSGYKLSVPLGQSSLIIFEGVNFATEKDMMTAAGVFDLDAIKKKLGEQ